MADQQRYGTKRKSQDDDANTRVTKHKAESVPDAEPAAKAVVPAPAAPPPTERFLMSEFKTCLFSCIAQRYLGVKETVNEHTSELLETYGTWPHPMDATKMTFRAWAFRFEVLRVLQTHTELSVENREELPNGLYRKRGYGQNVVSICLDYVDTLVTLRKKMAIGYALLKTRFESFIDVEITNGYNRSAETLPVVVPDITRNWVSCILAHVKYTKPGTLKCAEWLYWRHTNELPDMYMYRDDLDCFWVSDIYYEQHPLTVSDLTDEYPIAFVFNGYVEIPGTGKIAPAPAKAAPGAKAPVRFIPGTGTIALAPGTFHGIHNELAELARIVEPNPTLASLLLPCHSDSDDD